jgi:hypothetical protein
LDSLDAVAEPDVVFHAGLLPPGLNVREVQRMEPFYRSPYTGPDGEPISRIWRCPEVGLYYIDFPVGLAFVVDSGGKTIWAQWPGRLGLEIVTAILLGRILAFVLHLRGHVCLHASAVVVDGGAVLFAGDPGMGKSSTAAAFAERGCPVLSDDLSAIRREGDGRLMVTPGVPRVCLWPDSVKFLYGPQSDRRFPLLLPEESKHVVRLDRAAGKFQTEPAKFKAVYLLMPRTWDPAAPRIEPVAGADRLIRLLYSGFMNLALDKEQTAREFQILGEIARSVRIRQLVPSGDPQKLNQLYELVANDVREPSLSVFDQPN